ENPNPNPNPDGAIVLRVYVHCQGCAEDIRRSLRGFDGVEGLEIDEKNHKVTVRGKEADPHEVVRRLRKKTGKAVELISFHPKKDVEKEPPPELQPKKVMEIVLKVYLHCEGCAKEVKKCILDVEGVEAIEIDLQKNSVMVRGTMDPDKLTDAVARRHRRRVEIAK
ncbi:hypothetical protein M569_16325, partial [Genlisea aurea]